MAECLKWHSLLCHANTSKSITTSQHSQDLVQRLTNPQMHCQGRELQAEPKQAVLVTGNAALQTQSIASTGELWKHQHVWLAAEAGRVPQTLFCACKSTVIIGNLGKSLLHLLHTDHTHAGIRNTDQFIKGAKLELDRHHQSEDEIQQ